MNDNPKVRYDDEYLKKQVEKLHKQVEHDLYILKNYRPKHLIDMDEKKQREESIDAFLKWIKRFFTFKKEK